MSFGHFATRKAYPPSLGLLYNEAVDLGGQFHIERVFVDVSSGHMHGHSRQSLSRLKWSF